MVLGTKFCIFSIRCKVKVLFQMEKVMQAPSVQVKEWNYGFCEEVH